MSDVGDSLSCGGTFECWQSFGREVRVRIPALLQWPFHNGRQFTQGLPDLTQEHEIHRPLPLHRQHTGMVCPLKLRYTASVNYYAPTIYAPTIPLPLRYVRSAKSHSAAPVMHAYSTRELRAKMQVVTSALLLFTLHISFVVVKPIQSKQVEVSVLHLASYIWLHHTLL